MQSEIVPRTDWVAKQPWPSRPVDLMISSENQLMQNIQLIIAICTHNRSAELAGCLSALCPQHVPGVQIVVVDSASSHEERLAIAKLVESYAEVELIRLDEPGLSLARNAALALTPALWIAYLDDDTIPSETWIEVALQLVGKVDGSYAVIGGKTNALLPPGMTPVLGQRWQQLLSLVEINGEGDQTAHPRVVGANIILRTEVLNRLGGFSKSLGRVGKSLLSGEEKLLIEKISSSGNRIWYSDRLHVRHRITADRLTNEWVNRRAYWDGVSDYKIAALSKRHPSLLWHLKLAAGTLFLAALYPIRNRHEFPIRFWYNLGWLHSCFRAGIAKLGLADRG